MSHQPIQNSVALFRGHRQIPGLISCNNFVKKNFVCIGHRDKVLARCDSIFPLLRCQRSVEQNVHTTFSFQNPLSESEELQSWGCSAIILDAIWWSFLAKSVTAAMFTSVWVDFGWPPLSSSSTSSIPSRNREYQIKCLIGSEPHSHKPFAPILVFLSQTDQLWNNILWQLSVHFRCPWCIKNTDFKRQVINPTVSKINKQNSVCERMLVDSN